MASASVEAKSIGYLSVEMTKNFKKALQALAGLSPAMAKFGMVAAKAADAVAKLTLVGPIVQLAQKFEALGKVIKVAFSPLTTAIGAVGKIFSGIKNILMLPFGIMSKAFSGLSKAWDFITKPAEGANASAYEAAKLNMSAVQLHELEYAEKASGTNGQFKSLLENVRGVVLDKDKQTALGTLGLNTNELGNMNAVDALQKVFEAIQRRTQSIRGFSYNSMQSKAFYDEAGLSQIMSFDDAKAMSEGFYGSTMGHFQNFMKTTQYNEKSFRKLNTRVVEVQRAFDNLHKQLSARLGPAAARVAGVFVKVLSKLGEAIFTDENIKKLENGLNVISKKIEEFFNGDKWKEKIMTGIDAVGSAMRALAKLIMWIIDKTSSFTGIKVDPAIFDFIDSDKENAARYAKKAEEKINESIAKTFGKSWLERTFSPDNVSSSTAEMMFKRARNEALTEYTLWEGKEKGQQYDVFHTASNSKVTFTIVEKATGKEVYNKTTYFDVKINQ